MSTAASAPHRRKLPIGIQNLREIRQGGYYYVDKSGLAADLVATTTWTSPAWQPT